MENGIAALDQPMDLRCVAEIAGHDLLVRRRGAEIGNVGKAHNLGQMDHASPHGTTQCPRRTRDQQSLQVPSSSAGIDALHLNSTHHTG
ncbi:hypothetical protein D3C80_1866260 [compost metagenome]